MEDSNVAIFAQAKLEYTKQLVDVLYMNMYDGIRSIYDDSKRLYAQKATSILYIFRSLLENVPKWNAEIIEAETERIIRMSKCDWLDDLLTAVFISHTRILMSIGPNQNYNKINVTIPKTTTFIHKTYINIAREVWKNPYLFSEQVPGHEYQRNMKQVEDMIKSVIEDTIRRQLPIKEILKEHLETYDEPKQAPQPAFDMKMLVDEIKKVAGQAPSEPVEEPEEPVEDHGGGGVDGEGDGDGDGDGDGEGESDDSVHVEPESSDIQFIKEVEVEPENSDVPDTPSDMPSDMPSDIPTEITTPPIEDPYRDPEDPSQSQIEKATQGIVLNDITEPVVEPVYDNVDIVTETSSSPKKSEAKLKEMIQDLQKPIDSLTSDIQVPETLSSLTDSKPVTTDQKPPNPDKSASVIKIEDPFLPPLDPPKLPELNSETTTVGGPSVGGTQAEENKIETKGEDNKDVNKDDNKEYNKEEKKEEKKDDNNSVTKNSTTVKKLDDSNPFSFSNLYPSLSKSEPTTVEKVGNPEPVPSLASEPVKPSEPEITKDTNASVMKEVITLDKQGEDIDETQTLDNFFNDIQKMVAPMEPIKEETKYTLFEDAEATESS